MENFKFFHSFFLPPSLIVLTKCNIHIEGWRHTAPGSLPPDIKRRYLTTLDDTLLPQKCWESNPAHCLQFDTVQFYCKDR